MGPCSKCGSTEYESGSREQRYPVDGREYAGDVSGQICRQCGAFYPDGPDGLRFERDVAARVAREGLPGPAGVRLLLVLTGGADTVGDLLGLDGNSIRDWALGRAPIPRTAWLALASLASDAFEGRSVTADRLRALAS